MPALGEGPGEEKRPEGELPAPGELGEGLSVVPAEEFKALFKEEKYRQRIAKMARDGSSSVIVDFEDIYARSPELATALVEKPRAILAYASEAAKEQLRIEEPEYAEKIREITVRISRLPELTLLRKLSSAHIGKLVSIEGIVVRATPVRPLVVNATFKCLKCGQPILSSVGKPTPAPPVPRSCPFCKSRGPFELDEERTEFIDYQEIRVQEKPEDLPPGQLPRWVNARIIGSDLVDLARPGDRVVITGIVRVSEPRGLAARRGLDMYIEVNNVEVATREAEAIEISPEEEKLIRELAKDPNIHEKIIRSIAPSIYGYEHVKEAIMYLLFGGVTKELPDVRKRGDIHVLLIGDPGTGKSALLQYVAKIAPRGLYTSGRGTTAAGLTAAVIREAQGGMSLEAGALVLADKGVCAIDEIEKMRAEDRVAIHEALEQQTISIAKGGIVATLNARTAVLAAANPALGRYDPYRSVVENISLPITILSRFDLIFVIRDVPDKEVDAMMATHILDTHRAREAPVEPPIPPGLLRKYISYAKLIEPKLTEEAVERIRSFYLEMRALSSGEGSPIAITARQLESLIRIAEARARAALRDYVTAEDAEAAINIMKRSLQEVGIDVETKRIDIDVIMTGKPKSLRDKLQLVLDAIERLDEGDGVSELELVRELEQEGIPEDEVIRLLGVLRRDGMIFEARAGRYKKV